MNTIKRDVYVLKNTIKIPIEVTKGTDAITFEFTVRDYNLPVTAASVAYAYRMGMKKPNSTLCDVSGNVISFQPSANFFEVGNNELQIRVINEDKSLISFKEKVKCSDSMGFPDEEEETDRSLIEQIIAQSGKESGKRKAADAQERAERIEADAKEKSERQKEIATERARIDQLTKMGEGSTTGDAELADIRVGNEGAAYSNAGNAVRAQTKDVPVMMDNLQSPYVDISLLEQGSINSAVGSEIASSKVLRSVEFHWNKNGKITAPAGYKIAIANYAMQPEESGQMTKVYMSFENYSDSQTSSKADGDAESRRLLIKRSDGADINAENLRGKIATNVPGLRAMDVIENLEKKIKTDTTLEKEGIAADAAETGKRISQVKEDLSDVNNSISTTADTYTIAPADMESGTIDKTTGVESESNNTIYSKDFVDISSTKSFVFSGITANPYYVRIVYYDSAKTFLKSTDGFKANEESVEFIKPNQAKHMRIVLAYITLDDIGYIKPIITYTNLIDGDTITRSVRNGKFRTSQNDWEILEGKWVDIPTGQTLKRTDSRNSCTANFLHAKKGNELILQSPISFSIMLFSEADETTCFYNSYKDGVFYSGYKFNSDCYFLLNFTNQQDSSAKTKKSDIVWTKNTVKDVQTVFIVPNAEYSTIHVASAWASDEEKMRADYVCDGVNDGEELQQAIFDLQARGGGVLKLSNERYIIDALFDSGNTSVGKYGIYIPTNNFNVSLIKIEGVNFPNVIQPMYFGHCTRFDMSQELYDSLGENEIVSIIGVKPVISGSGKVSRSSVGCTLSAENIAINIPAPQKKIIGVNCEYAYNMQLKGVHCGLTEYAGDPQEPNGKIINSNIDCIGIRTIYGYNWGSGYHIDDCNVRGWGLGFDISGEHLIMQNACARFVNTSYRFGHFGDDEMMSHPNTLINCCEEWLLHGMVFEGNGLGQAVNIIDFNIEDMSSNGWGRKTLATESVKGAYKGTLTYTTTKDSYKNSQEKFWADDGSGKNIITRDLNDKFSGITSERPKYPQNNQQYFDTTVNKMLYFINGKWVDAMGTVIN